MDQMFTRLNTFIHVDTSMQINTQRPTYSRALNAPCATFPLVPLFVCGFLFTARALSQPNPDRRGSGPRPKRAPAPYTVHLVV